MTLTVKPAMSIRIKAPSNESGKAILVMNVDLPLPSARYTTKTVSKIPMKIVSLTSFTLAMMGHELS